MRWLALLRTYATWLLIFATQKAVFMLVNIGLSAGAPFGECLSALWHGLRLDSVTACYLLILPAILTAISHFFRRFPLRRILAPYNILAAALVGLIFAADTILYLFWGAKLDANDLIYATNPKDMLASLPLWALILALLLVALIVWHYYRRLRHATPNCLPNTRSPLRSLVLLPVGALLLLGMRGSVTESTANPSYAYFSSHPFCNHAALNPTFNMLHSLFKSQDLQTEFSQHDNTLVDSIIADAYTYDSTIVDTLLRTSNPNILLIIWESGGSGMLLNDSVGPSLSSLIPQSIYFSQCYANNFRTDRGLISLINGWPGLPTTSLMKRSDICRNLPSLASTLARHGYATSFTYGGDIDFTNMRYYLAETGFTTLHGSQHFPSRYYTSAWGIPDEHLLTTDLIPPQRPFLAATLTLSSHEPWQVPFDRLADAKQNAFAYTDSCIGALVNQLKTTPLWDSLLIIIVPDHGVTYADIHTTADPRVAHIPVLWLGGAIRQPRTIPLLMNQSDIAATLLAQMHLDASHFLYSRNVLSPSYPTRPAFAMHAYKNGLNLITPDTIATYDCINRTLISPPDAAAQLRIEALLQHIYQTTATLPQH